ncbi:MAG: SDR family oxidoreductase [Chloroflexi bacterium]|nr:SDR family oxidoreductase [Chloroflexota bacterium]
MELTNRKIIVVGGSSGMGLAVVRAALTRGAEVVAVGRSAERLERVASELGVKTIAADVTSEDEVLQLFDLVGSFDHLVVTAASNPPYQTIRDLDLDAARQTIDTKLVAALLLSKYAARQINEHGSITFTAGIAAERPLPTGFLVGAVNGSLFSLAYGLAIALAPVRVNAISPGWTDTPLLETVLGARKTTMVEQMAQRLPVGQIGRPEDIAHAVLFLMENEFTTGSVLHVDGGHRLI